ncbi:MAG: hypothetical protein ACJAQT_002612 [Akkermansiaceae bacterium]|jgi:hypothetical protein
MRSLLLILSIIAGYALLRGWPGNWHPIMRVCLAVSALVLAFALWGRPEKPTSTLARSARKPRPLDYLTVGIAVLLVECFFLVFLSLAPSKSENLALDLDESLHPEIYRDDSDSLPSEESTTPGLGGNRVTSNWLFSGPGSRSLNKSDKVIPSNRPEVYLFPNTKTDAQSLLLTDRFLRSFTLATYSNGSWSPQAAIPKTLRATGEAIIFPEHKTGTKVTYDISHQANPGGQTLAVTLPKLTSIKLPSLRETAPATFRLPTNTSEKNTFRYQATSNLFTFDQIISPITPGTSPSPEYLVLPEDAALRERIQTLASTFGPPSTQSLVKLRKYLHERYTYSLDVNLPENADPLSSFLFQTRTGYCTHFATATAILTRAMGIPSRIAFGWSGGRYFQGPNLFVFRAREAHAWTEIFLADHGWVIFETTPATREEGAPSLADSDEPPPLLDPINSPETEAADSDLAPLLKVATLAGIASALALLVALFLRRPTTPSGEQSAALSILPDPPNYLTAFRRACTAHGHPIPPGRTLRAHLEKITAPPFTSDLLHYHYAVQYGDAPRNKATEKKLLSQLRIWEKEIP